MQVRKKSTEMQDRCFLMFSQKNWHFLLKTKLNYGNICSEHWCLRKTPIFSHKIVIIDPGLEKSDENFAEGSSLVQPTSVSIATTFGSIF
jgi:hypothetical protein